MVNLGNRRSAHPLIINPGKQPTRLRRVPFTENVFEEG